MEWFWLKKNKIKQNVKLIVGIVLSIIYFNVVLALIFVNALAYEANERKKEDQNKDYNERIIEYDRGVR